MNRDEIRAAILADPNLKAMIPNWEAIANALPPEITLREVFVTERGIVNVLGIIEGEIFLQALEGFATADLPDEHPLKPYQPGIARQIAWLKRDGVDVGSAVVRMLLDTMTLVNIVTPQAAQAIKNIAEVRTPINEFEVRKAVMNDDGSFAI
jgi:hypothetical protein